MSSELIRFTTLPSSFMTVWVTCDQKDMADLLSKTLVKESLAACVNQIGPVKSTYQWEGEIQESEEWLLIIKTTAAALEGLNKRIHQLHTYSVPEVIALPILAGSSKYLSWLSESVHL